MVSVRREVIGKRVAKSTYSPFVMADEVAFCQMAGKGRLSELGLGRRSQQERRGNQDQKERRCLRADSQLGDFEEKEEVAGVCFGCHLAAVEEDWT